ncbi:MAG: hypothetical protein NTY09_01225, partial [bacterium]|nr:hypothetical protein [bacterium]
VPVADPPPPGDEYDYWLDPNCPPPSSFSPNKVWKDGYRLGEKYIDVISMDSYLSIQGLEEVKVRVTDYRDNWTRSGNLLESEDEGYSVLDLMFRDNNMYEDETCYHAGDPNDDDRRVGCDGVGCDGYVLPRPGGVGILDVAAVVSAYNPPVSITVSLTAPSDERGSVSGDPLYVSLFRLSQQSSWNEWWEIYADSACAGIAMYDCVEIYCRAAPGRYFYYAFNPYAVVVTDNEFTTLSSPEFPVIDGATPYLYVTSGDHMINDPNEERDYSVAIGDSSEPDLWKMSEPMRHVHYGDGNRGTFEIPGCEADKYDGLRNNVLTFGAEWVRADCDGTEAYYPVQSESDIMFVHAHGIICGFNDDGFCDGNRFGESFMYYFPDDRIDRIHPVYPEDILFADDWEQMIGRDADWLAATSCWLLADLESTGHLYQPWVYWQWLTLNTSLNSVLGFRRPHISPYEQYWTGTSPPPSPEKYFWNRFCYLLELGNYAGVVSRWDSEVPSEEYGCRCYMEAAWEYVSGELGDVDERPQHTSWGTPDEYHIEFRRAVASVSESSRYQLRYVEEFEDTFELKIIEL